MLWRLVRNINVLKKNFQVNQINLHATWYLSLSEYLVTIPIDSLQNLMSNFSKHLAISSSPP